MCRDLKQAVKFVIAGIFLQSLLLAQKPSLTDIENLARNIQWFGQSTIKFVTSSKIIYIDPFRIVKPDRADIIFITHDHKDHLDPASLAKIMTAKTIIVAPLSCRKKIKTIGAGRVEYLVPWDSTQIAGIPVLAVPAYNIEKTQFHPKSKNYLGYVLTIDGVRIYHAGDTERIPEMQQFDCDIAMLPLGQKYTMSSVYDAANAALDVKAKIAIPIHYGIFEGKQSDAATFQKILKNKIKVIIKSSASF